MLVTHYKIITDNTFYITFKMAFTHEPITQDVNIVIKEGGCEIYTTGVIMDYIKQFYAIFSLSKYSGMIKFSYELNNGKIEPQWTPQILQFTKIGQIMRQLDDTLKQSLDKLIALEIANCIFDQIKGRDQKPKTLDIEYSVKKGIYWTVGKIRDNKTSSSYNLTDVEIQTNAWKKGFDNKIIPFKDGEKKLLEDIKLNNDLFSKSRKDHPLNKLKEIYSAYFAVRFLFEKNIQLDIGSVNIFSPIKQFKLENKKVVYDIVIGKNEVAICVNNEWFLLKADPKGKIIFDITRQPSKQNVSFKYTQQYYCVNGGVICNPKEISHINASSSPVQMSSKSKTAISNLEFTNFLISSLRNIHNVNYMGAFLTITEQISSQQNTSQRKRSDNERLFRALSSSAAITASIMNYSLIGNSISFSMIYSELYENANRKTLQYAEKIAEQIRKSDGNKQKLEEIARDVIFNHTISVGELP